MIKEIDCHWNDKIVERKSDMKHKSNYTQRGLTRDRIKASIAAYFFMDKFKIPFTAAGLHVKFIDKLSTGQRIELFDKMKWAEHIAFYNEFCRNYEKGMYKDFRMRDVLY